MNRNLLIGPIKKVMLRLSSILRLICVMLLISVSSMAFAQKFYYEGGYFEKQGNSWYEYKPDQKAGVWNRFNETRESNDDFYIIDNGNCKVSVPKHPDKDFYILLKGRNDWEFKYKSAAAPQSKKPDVVSNSVKSPRDRRAFHRAYFNEGGVCILASYSLLLDYANSTANIIPDFDSYDVMSEFMRFQNTLEPTKQISAPYLRANHREGEQEVSKAINGYCMARGWSGLIQVANFHKWLSENKKDWAGHVEIVERGLDREGRLNNTRQTLPYAYPTLKEMLSQNADDNRDYDYASILIYYVEEASSYHAIFLGCDKDGLFMRGPNFHDKFTDSICDFNFRFTPDAPIVEYIIMKIKRPDRSEDYNRWKSYDASAFRSSSAAAVKSKLDKPIPVRSIKVDPKNKVGNKNLTASVLMASKSDPSFTVEFTYGASEKSIKVNGTLGWGGRSTSDGMIEYDLKQICPDLQIVSYTPWFEFNNFYYQ